MRPHGAQQGARLCVSRLSRATLSMLFLKYLMPTPVLVACVWTRPLGTGTSCQLVGRMQLVMRMCDSARTVTIRSPSGIERL